MNRKKFIHLVGCSCLALSSAPLLLTGCSPIHRVRTSLSAQTLTIAKSEFIFYKDGQEQFRQMVQVSAAGLAFPIALYRTPTNRYTALWMECTHQSCEVNAHGNYLVCPCHGSEFDASGQVLKGPAETNLRTFKVNTDHENIYIHVS